MDDKHISVKFNHESDPENCNNVNDVCEKLDKGAKFWSIFPDMAKVEEVPINILKMMKKQANDEDDKVLKKVSDFLEKYLEEHTHFLVIGLNSALKMFLQQMSHQTRPAIKTLLGTSISGCIFERFFGGF